MSELVSVIIPIYNTEKYLQRCVDSILRQDYTNLEIILVDDGSPDQCGIMCDEIADKNDRIRVVHKTNGGLSSARNAGLEVVQGEYICFVDSDDYVADDYVSTLYNMIQENHADLAKINYVEVDTDDYSVDSNGAVAIVFEGEQVEKAFLQLRVDSVCVFMYRKSLIRNIRFPEGKTSEDIPFNFQAFQLAKRFAYLQESKYFYYHNPNSISNGSLDSNMLNYLNFRKVIYEYYYGQDNEELKRLSRVLYARAAMGLMTRMAFYGISKDMSEKDNKAIFKEVFSEHSGVFFKDKGTALNRKMLAALVFYCYPVAKAVGIFLR